tara:strand:- start:179 stop:721 length:543 start_codon:yes stop_codon:yes gene_type:complete
MLKKTLLLMTSLLVSNYSQADGCAEWTNYELRKLRSSETINFCEFEGKPLLIVNTASNCGFTPQFKSLEAIHQKYRDQGLVVLGFPSNDFFQEEADEKDTANMCYLNYGVSFTMLSPISIRGTDAHPLFKYLGDNAGSPKWNFNKYLVSADRNKIIKYGSFIKPDSDKFQQAVLDLLGNT